MIPILIKENYMTSDMYPDLGFNDIIEMLNRNDHKRLERASYSTDGFEIISDLYYKYDGDLYHNFDIYYGNSSENALPTVVNVHGGGWFMGLKRFANRLVFIWLNSVLIWPI